MSQIKVLVSENIPSFFREISLAILLSILIGISGQISIPLLFTPVPLAIQGHVILLLAALLGSRRAVAATLAFLAQGAMGLPVFSVGSSVGMARFLGPTGGYLIGYLVAAWVVGLLIEKMKESTSLKQFLVMALGNGLIFTVGLIHLSAFIGFEKAFLLGVLPFLLGDLFKLIVCVKLLEKIRAR